MQSTRFYIGISAALLGVAVGTLVPIRVPVGIFFVLLGIAVLTSGMCIRQPLLIGSGLIVMLFAGGLLRVSIVSRALPLEFTTIVGVPSTLEGEVVSDPDERETTSRATIRIERGTAHTNILAVVPRYPEVAIGERVRVHGTPQIPKPFDADGGRVFDYPNFLANDGIFLLIPRASLSVIAPRSGLLMQIRGFLADQKRTFVRALQVALPEPASALAVGLLAGGKQGLGKELLEAFTIAGLLQLVVLSGYNVMIVAEAILVAFGFLPRRLALVFASLGIVAFIIAAGSGTSAIRAGIMACIALFARGTNRTYAVLRALCVALLLMVLVNPLLLLYDPGLQLSCIATLGLILGTPIIEPKLAWMRTSWLREIIATSIAAQVAVLPLLLYQSGNLSIVALPATILATPVIPLAMGLSFVASIVALLVPTLAPLVGIPAYLVLSYVISVAQIAASLSFAQIIIPAFPAGIMVLSYGALALLVVRLLPRENASQSRSSLSSREMPRRTSSFPQERSQP